MSNNNSNSTSTFATPKTQRGLPVLKTNEEVQAAVKALALGVQGKEGKLVIAGAVVTCVLRDEKNWESGVPVETGKFLRSFALWYSNGEGLRIAEATQSNQSRHPGESAFIKLVRPAWTTPAGLIPRKVIAQYGVGSDGEPIVKSEEQAEEEMYAGAEAELAAAEAAKAVSDAKYAALKAAYAEKKAAEEAAAAAAATAAQKKASKSRKNQVAK